MVFVLCCLVPIWLSVLSFQVPAHPCRDEVIGVYPLLMLFMV
jgi:hypothetical protein